MAKGFRNYIDNTMQRIISSEGITHSVYATVMELYYGKPVYKTVENAYEEISQIRFKPSGTCYTADRQCSKQPRYDLDIIIPVYNVESYLQTCLNSVIDQQTKYSYRTIIVDDGSTDKSSEIIEKFSGNASVLIIKQKNRGVSVARNAGLDCVDARYVLFVDSDDILSDGAVEMLLDKAFENNADIVEGGFDTFNDGKTVSHTKRITGLSTVSSLSGFPWGKVIRASYFKNLSFPAGYLFEDTIFGFILYQLVQTVYTINEQVYKYRLNEKGLNLNSKQTPNRVDSFWVTIQILSELDKFGICPSESLYTLLLQQISMNFKRTFQLKPKTIQYACFRILTDIVNEKWRDYSGTLPYQHLDTALKNKKFGDYLVACLEIALR
ncbi:glycosyltransferase family 2 protein [Lactiplantibacillus plantarum]|uniref:glycosyltransferase family 2 protein n=1 Tax=Lactiplantibacillus plantarum TaxID=1590 RepID=UPI00244DA1E4|nr:glycosyltransferase [Lactiplantibacillus plantarum]WGI47494.1 glycosyltransferase [Lactiplantibacillus plantarum]